MRSGQRRRQSSPGWADQGRGLRERPCDPAWGLCRVHQGLQRRGRREIEVRHPGDLDWGQLGPEGTNTKESRQIHQARGRARPPASCFLATYARQTAGTTRAWSLLNPGASVCHIARMMMYHLVGEVEHGRSERSAETGLLAV